MGQFTCPHCGGICKVIAQRNYEQSDGTFENVAPARIGTPPRSGLGSFLWFLTGRKANLPARSNAVTVKVEEWNYSDNVIKFHDMDDRVTFKAVKEIAEMVATGHDWTRDNLVKHTSLSENKTRIYIREFKRLGYLEVSLNNRSDVTSPGRRFLRSVLRMDGV